jgi:hypothetical protein
MEARRDLNARDGERWGIEGESLRMRAMYRQVENGTGKGLIAQALHRPGLRGLQYRLRAYGPNGHHASASEGSIVLA